MSVLRVLSQTEEHDVGATEQRTAPPPDPYSLRRHLDAVAGNRILTAVDRRTFRYVLDSGRLWRRVLAHFTIRPICALRTTASWMLGYAVQWCLERLGTARRQLRAVRVLALGRDHAIVVERRERECGTIGWA